MPPFLMFITLVYLDPSDANHRRHLSDIQSRDTTIVLAP